MAEVEDVHLRALLAQFGVGRVTGKSMLARISARDDLRRGWTIALERAAVRVIDATLTAWVKGELQRLATGEVSGDAKALAAEVEAALRLSWISTVHRPAVGKRPTCDFRVGALNVEVYCPQQHVEERRVVEAGLAVQSVTAAGPAKVAIMASNPATGSGRKLDGDGRVVRDPCSRAASFPTNKLIDRLLSRKKREAKQFVAGESNVLWLDLKHGLEFCALHCSSLQSILSKGTCFVGMKGVWHAFYGRKGDPLFAERTVLEYPVRRATYQQQREGWFREIPQASCVLLSVLDGVVRLDNPWASVPLASAASASILSLSELRPEFSWFDERAQTLAMRVEAERRRITWVAQHEASEGLS